MLRVPVLPSEISPMRSDLPHSGGAKQVGGRNVDGSSICDKQKRAREEQLNEAASIEQPYRNVMILYDKVLAIITVNCRQQCRGARFQGSSSSSDRTESENASRFELARSMTQITLPNPRRLSNKALYRHLSSCAKWINAAATIKRYRSTPEAFPRPPRAPACRPECDDARLEHAPGAEGRKAYAGSVSEMHFKLSIPPTLSQLFLLFPSLFDTCPFA